MWYIVHVLTDNDETRLNIGCQQTAVDTTIRLSELGYHSYITEEDEPISRGEAEEVRAQQIIAEISRLDVPNGKLH